MSKAETAEIQATGLPEIKKPWYKRKSTIALAVAFLALGPLAFAALGVAALVTKVVYEGGKKIFSLAKKNNFAPGNINKEKQKDLSGGVNLSQEKIQEPKKTKDLKKELKTNPGFKREVQKAGSVFKKKLKGNTATSVKKNQGTQIYKRSPALNRIP